MTSTGGPEIVPANQRDIAGEKKQIDLVNAEGRMIFVDFSERLKQPEFSQLDPQSQYEYYMKIYPDFARSNPIILRYITLNMFSEKAVFLYLMRCYEQPIKTNEDYCERQADFVKYLYHCTTPIRGEKLNDIWKETRNLLMDEIKKFDEDRDRIKAERLSRQDANDEIKRETIKIALTKRLTELREQILANRKDVESVPTTAEAPASSSSSDEMPSADNID